MNPSLFANEGGQKPQRMTVGPPNLRIAEDVPEGVEGEESQEGPAQNCASCVDYSNGNAMSPDAGVAEGRCNQFGVAVSGGQVCDAFRSRQSMEQDEAIPGESTSAGVNFNK